MEETGSLPSSLGSEGTVERNSALGDWNSLSPPHYRPQTPAQPAVCTCPITQERAHSQPVREVSILGQILATRSVESCQSALQPQLGSRPCQPPTLPPLTSFLEQLLIRPGCFRCCTRATGGVEEEARIYGVHLAPLKGMGDRAQANVTPSPIPEDSVEVIHFTEDKTQ